MLTLTLFNSSKINRRFAACAALGLGVAAHAAPLDTTDGPTIANFQQGATVQTFDNIAGVTAVPIDNYNAKDLTTFPTALFNKDTAPGQSAFYNSGGATFSDPGTKPGTPIGIAAPDPASGIANNKLSGANVAGPLGINPPPPILFDSGAFMEVIFPSLVSKVGVYVASGTLSIFLKDSGNQNLATGDFEATGVTAGHYIGFERASADVGGVTFIGQGAFTIDDFTYLVGTSDNNNNNTGAPDGGSTFGLALGAMSLIVGGKRFLKTTRS